MEPAELFDWLRRNPIVAIWLLLMVFTAIGRLFGGSKKRQEAGRSEAAGPREARADPAADLEERIRRNFEEMLRRRAAAAPPAESASAPPAPPPPPKAAPARTHVAPARRNYDEAAPREPARVRTVRQEPTRVRRVRQEPTRGAAPAPERRSGDAAPRRGPVLASRTRAIRTAMATKATKAAGLAKFAAPVRGGITRARATRHELLDRAALRRAIVFSEVLGAPRSLRPE